MEEISQKNISLIIEENRFHLQRTRVWINKLLTK